MVATERFKVWLSPNKVHKLQLTNRFMELARAWKMISAGDLSRGGKAQQLEEAFRQRFNVSSALILPHARTALYCILRSLDLKDGDEVLMPPLTIADMVNSIHAAGLRPVFVDIELDTCCIDADKIEQSITPRSKVLLVTYLFGLVPNVAKIRDVARKHGLILIEDCSQCLDGVYDGQPVGTFGEAAFFSLTNFKVCSSLFGGMVITNNEGFAERLRCLRETDMLPAKPSILRAHIIKNMIYTFAFSKFMFSYFTYFVVLGLEKLDPRITYRLYSGNIKVLLKDFENTLVSQFPSNYLLDYTDAQAYVGLASLSRAAKSAAARKRNGDLLISLLKDNPNLKIPTTADNTVNVYWRFPVLTKDLDGLKKCLLEHGIDSSPTYLCLCSKEPAFKPYHRQLPNAERLKKEVLIVEVHEGVREKDIRHMASVINQYFERKEG